MDWRDLIMVTTWNLTYLSVRSCCLDSLIHIFFNILQSQLKGNKKFLNVPRRHDNSQWLPCYQIEIFHITPSGLPNKPPRIVCSVNCPKLPRNAVAKLWLFVIDLSAEPWMYTLMAVSLRTDDLWFHNSFCSWNFAILMAITKLYLCLSSGLINSVWWIGWCMANIRRKPYLKNPIICIIAANLLLLLELLDFPPVMWTLDAHSLWHAGTIPLIFIWYK